MRVLGVDGARGGWAVVALEHGRFVDSHFVDRFADVACDPAVVIGVDIPLGETTPGDRMAESAARARIGARRSSVFTPAPLAAADATDYEQAKAIAMTCTGKGISKQAWHLLPKMIDVEEHWRAAPERIREVHPECSFREMRGAPLTWPKKTWPGLADRLRLLRDRGIDLVAGCHHDGRVAPDDVIDAAAVAWTAHRIASGVAVSLPDPPECDDAGRPVAIWY